MKQKTLESLRNSDVYKTMKKYTIARDSDKVWYIRYLQDFVCHTEQEKQVVENVLLRASITEASFARVRRYIQKDLWELKASLEVQKNRKRKRDKVIDFVRENKTYSFMQKLFSVFNKKD